MRSMFLLAAILLGACAPEADVAVTPPAPPVADQRLPAPTPETVRQRLTAADDGRTVSVAVGQRFAVELVGVPTAGYVWQVDARPAFLGEAQEVSGNTSARQAQPGFTGGNHWEVFVFEVQGAGAGVLKLAQRRPWEKDEPPTQTFSVTVEAR